MSHFQHLTKDGERWDLLAYHYYGDQNKQGLLIEANRDLFIDPLVVPPMILPSGLFLEIPVIEEEAVDEVGLPPWKRANPDYGTAA